MKCLVCGKNYNDYECPRCGFPDLQLPLGKELEEARKKVQPKIDAHRAEFLKKIEVGIKVYYWKDQDGVLAADREEKCSFGSGSALYGKTVWLDQKFARVPEEKTLPIWLYIRVDGTEHERIVELPNLQEAQLQEIGLSMDNGFELCLMLRNDSGTPVYSNRFSLFD